MTKKELEEKVLSLEKEIERLKVQQSMVIHPMVIHHHYHNDIPDWQPQPTYIPSLPYTSPSCSPTLPI